MITCITSCAGHVWLVLSKNVKIICRKTERERELAGDADRDVDINVGTHMLLWLEAFRPVTNAKAQVVHQVMLLLYVTEFSAALLLLVMLLSFMGVEVFRPVR